MHRILYISTTRAPIDPPQLDQILRASRRNNALADITGLLVVGGRRFLQVLEGPKAAVAETFERISRDPRHFAIVTLNDKAVDERAFAGWAMGCEVGGAPSEGVSLEQQVEQIIAPVTDANLRAYFTGFARSHSSAT